MLTPSFESQEANVRVPRRAARSARVSVVVPVHCEAELIAATISEIAAALATPARPYELVIVDDGSTDRTWTAIAESTRSHPEIRALRLSRRFGKEAAIRAGLESANGDVVVVMDGDLQHPPRLIGPMLALWEQGADVVEAVKENRGDERLFSSLRARLFYAILSALSGSDLTGATDFKLLDRRVVEAYLALPERNLFFRGVVGWLGFRKASIGFSVPPRVAGRSKWGLFALVRLAITAVTSFSATPLRLVTVLGFAFLAASFVLGAQTLYRKLTGSALDGFTTVILLVLASGSIVMIALGIIGEYLAKIYEEIKARPRYVVQERIPREGSDGGCR
jgi:glycosyltransferase involved in cell wall biosynthesis